MSKKTVIFFFFIIFLTSCAETNVENNSIVKISKNDFPIKVKIKGDTILSNDYNKNRSITVIDSILLLKVVRGNTRYNAYNKSSLEFLGGVGVIGDGPNQWKYVYDNSQGLKTDSAIFIWVYDFHKGFLSKVNLTATLKSSSAYPVIDTTIVINSNKLPFYHLIYVNENKLVSTSYIHETDYARIKYFNPNTEIVKKSELFPKIKNIELLPVPVKSSLYTSSLKKHPSKEIFAQAMLTFNRIDIFDSELNVIKSIVDGENWKDDYYDATLIDSESDFLSDKLMGYSNLSVSENFIIAVDYNDELSAIDGSVKGSYVKVFNWEGDPICLLNPKDNIFSVSLDEEEGILYATDIDNDNILRYDVKELIKKWKK